jgi:DNA-binding SARP family transcriptional activator
MEISVLGPLTVRAGRVTITPTAPKPRQVLALLLMHANQVVAVPSLARELWDENPPMSALTTLQTYVLQLRKLLAAGFEMRSAQVAKEILITKANGYLFKVEPGSLDLHRFDRLAREGRAALARDENDRAADLLRDALALWRGQALVDVNAGPLLSLQVVRLEEARLTALEHRIEADLRIGMHHEVLSELALLTEEHPLHENLHAQLMVALYRAGRRSEALNVFHRLRSRLLDELGLEPSVTMHRMQQAVLSAEPSLDSPNQRSAFLAERFAASYPSPIA